MGYNYEKWRAWENRKSDELEAKLNALLDAGDLEGFKAEYQEHALRYLTKKRRDPIYHRFLVMATKGR